MNMTVETPTEPQMTRVMGTLVFISLMSEGSVTEKLKLNSTMPTTLAHSSPTTGTRSRTSPWSENCARRTRRVREAGGGGGESAFGDTSARARALSPA